jgi:transposase
MKTSSPTVIGVGLDTARYGHHVSFLRDDLSRAAEPFSFAESREGYERLRQALEQLRRQHPRARIHIRIDAAGQYAVNLQRFLQKLPGKKAISLGEPKRNKDYRNVHFPKRKADAAESLACARFAVVERPAEAAVVPEAFLELREVLSALQSQTKRTTRLINQLHNRLSRAFPELVLIADNLAARSILSLLANYPTAGKVAAAELSALEAIPFLRSEKARAIHEAARQSTAGLCGPVVEGVIQQLVGEIVHSQRCEKKLETLLQQAYHALPAGNHVHVQSISGIGCLTAAALVANIVSIDRFATANALVNFYGVFPEESTSGVDRQGRPIPPGAMQMCHKGNDLIRKLLYMSALSAVQCNPAIRAFYARKRAGGTSGAVALGHCMQKLLHLVFAIWKTGKPFDPQHHLRRGAAANAADSAVRCQAGADHDRRACERGPRQAEETAAGRKEQGSKRQAVTAANPNLEAPAPDGKCGAGAIDFARLRAQVTIEQALRHLGHWEQLRGDDQRRGPCPIHRSDNAASRSFSVNLSRNVFQCFAPECQASGNVLDLWAAAHGLPLYDAALHLAATFNVPLPTRNREEEPVANRRRTAARNNAKKLASSH